MSAQEVPKLQQTLKLISKQTGVDDLFIVEKAFCECKENELQTIFKLMGMEMPQVRGVKLDHEKTVFDDVRQICDDKDVVFQNRIKST